VTRLAELTYEEAETLRARRPVVLVPLGALEAHGPHLPLETDCIIAEEMARRAAAALGARGLATAIAPTLVYARADYAQGFAGTVSLEPAAYETHLRAVIEGLHRGGWERVCLVNAHLEPRHVEAIRAAAAAGGGPKVAFPDKTERRWARTLSEEYKRGACHAGSYETSLVLAARPEAVRQGARAALPELAIDLARAMRQGIRTFEEAGAHRAYFGDPARASRDEGEALYARLCEMVVTVCLEVWPELSGPPA
jgi:creatinine amidohydrolase